MHMDNRSEYTRVGGMQGSLVGYCSQSRETGPIYLEPSTAATLGRPLPPAISYCVLLSSSLDRVAFSPFFLCYLLLWLALIGQCHIEKVAIYKVVQACMEGISTTDSFPLSLSCGTVCLSP